MERLIIVFDDESKITVTNKIDGIVQNYYERRVRGMPSVKSAVIQKYPKKANPPIVLVGGGA